MNIEELCKISIDEKDSFDINNYRKNNFNYSVGDFCYYTICLRNVRLRCVQAGVTDSNEPDFSNITSEGVILSDGTVKWKVEYLRYNSEDYSTTETRIGTWLDGSIIYKISFLMKSSASVNTFSSVSKNLSSLNIKRMIKYQGIMFRTYNSVTHNVDWFYSTSEYSGMYYYDAVKSFYIYTMTTGYLANADCFITIYYTKNSD